MRTSGTQSADAMPVPVLILLTPIIDDLFTKDHSTRGTVFRDVAYEALFLFPALVLGPKRPRASSCGVKTEVATRFDLLRQGELLDLVQRAKALAGQRPTTRLNTTTRAVRRRARLIQKNQFTRATSMAKSLGVVELVSTRFARYIYVKRQTE